MCRLHENFPRPSIGRRPVVKPPEFGRLAGYWDTERAVFVRSHRPKTGSLPARSGRPATDRAFCRRYVVKAPAFRALLFVIALFPGCRGVPAGFQELVDQSVVGSRCLRHTRCVIAYHPLNCIGGELIRQRRGSPPPSWVRKNPGWLTASVTNGNWDPMARSMGIPKAPSWDPVQPGAYIPYRSPNFASTYSRKGSTCRDRPLARSIRSPVRYRRPCR